MIVMKFDAGSISSADRLRDVAQLVKRNLGRRPVVVTSALPKVTDMLLETARLAESRDGEYEDRLEQIQAQHVELATAALPDGTARRAAAGEARGAVPGAADLLHGRRLARGADAPHARRHRRDRRAALVQAGAGRARAGGAARPGGRRAPGRDHGRVVLRGEPDRRGHGGSRPAPRETAARHRPRPGARRLHGRHPAGRDDDARPRRRRRHGGPRRGPARRRGDPDLERGRRHDHRRPAHLGEGEAHPGGLARGGGRARVLRGQGAPSR